MVTHPKTMGSWRQPESIKLFLLSSIWKRFTTTIVISALILAVKNPTLVQIEQLLVCVASLAIILASFITDLILIIYGEEMVNCCNWCYKAENDWSRHSMDFCLFSKYNRTTSKLSWFFRQGNTFIIQ